MFVVNKSERVYVIGEKHIIPGGDPVELTEDEANNPLIKAYIEAGHLEETAVKNVVSLEKMTVKQLQEYAAANNISLGEAVKKDEILAVIKSAKVGE